MSAEKIFSYHSCFGVGLEIYGIVQNQSRYWDSKTIMNPVLITSPHIASLTQTCDAIVTKR
jgi:hypothetical protein